MSNVTGIHHVSLLVDDLKSSVYFYQVILGLAPLERPPMGFDGAWLALGDYQQLHLLCLPNPRTCKELPSHGGRDQHVAFAVDSIHHLAETLDAHKVSFTESQSGRRALFFRDPDGNAIECVQTSI
jgi:glyoxylase I family protein